MLGVLVIGLLARCVGTLPMRLFTVSDPEIIKPLKHVFEPNRICSLKTR